MSSLQSKKQSISLKLPRDVLKWLDSAAEAHSLPDKSKAARCCINCVALGDVTIAPPESGSKDVDVQEVHIELAMEQVGWLEKQCGDTDGDDRSSVVRRAIRACIEADEKVVFGVVRCKSKVSVCEGAQKAVDLLKKKYGKQSIRTFDKHCITFLSICVPFVGFVLLVD